MTKTTAPNARGGFTFTEILFAVMILGVGFIMVAALFPVAAYQTQANAEETIGAATARGAVNALQQLSTNQLMPATGTPYATVRAYSGDLSRKPADGPLRREAVAGNLISPSDPRYGFIAFYRRQGTPGTVAPDWASVAQVYLIPVRAPTGQPFKAAFPPDIDARTRDNLTGAAILQATIRNGTDPDPDTIEFTGGDVAAAAEVADAGAYVLIADAQAPSGAAYFNGRIYRLGVAASDTTYQSGRPIKYELAAGNDFTPADLDGNRTIDVNQLTQARVFIIGRAGDGPAMDIGVYTTFVTVN